MLHPSTEGPLLAPLCPKVPRGSASSLPNSRLRTPIHVLASTDHSLITTRGLPNRVTIEGRAAVLLNPSGTGLLNLVAVQSRPRRTPLSTNNYRTSGPPSTTTLMNNSCITIATPTHNVCLGMYQVLTSDRCRPLFNSRVKLLCPSSTRNTKKLQGYRWISTRSLPAGRSMDCRSQATISWVAMSTHSWVVCFDLKMNSFLHITKKTASYCGKLMARLAHISDRNPNEYLHLILLSAVPPCRGYFIVYLALLSDVAVFCTRLLHLHLATIPTSFTFYSCYRCFSFLSLLNSYFLTCYVPTIVGN